MKKITAYVLSLSLCVTLCITAFGCSDRQKVFKSEHFDYFDSYARLTAVADSRENFSEYDSIFSEGLEYYHRLLDIYNEHDGTVNLCSLNRLAPSQEVTVDEELADFLSCAVDMHKITNGYASITIGALTRIWKQAIADNSLPDESEISLAACHTDINSLSLDGEGLSVRFNDPLLMLDAGAFAKGYAAGKLAAMLAEAGCESFLIDLGGTLYAQGEKPDGAAWTVGIEQTELSFSLEHRTLSTSASHYRGFERDGVRYHHIIDPYTHYPKNTFSSVSVFSPDPMAADALSTALFSMTLEEGQELIGKLDGTEAVWILASGEVVQ